MIVESHPVHHSLPGLLSGGELVALSAQGAVPDAELRDRLEALITETQKRKLTLPLFRVALNPRFTRPFYAVPRTSAARTASG